MFTPVTFKRNDFAKLASTLNLSSSFSFVPLKGGLINALYVLGRRKNSVVVRIYIRHKPLADIAYEIEAMDFLHQNGVSTPKVWMINGNSIVNIGKYSAIVLNRINGKTISLKKINRDQVISMAKTVGKVHRIGESFPDKKARVEWDLFDFQYDTHFKKKYTQKIKDSNKMQDKKFIL